MKETITRAVNVYIAEAEFDAFISGKSRTHKTYDAVVYDQYHRPEPIVRYASGTREEILSQYSFYTTAYPSRHLGLVCKEYYEQLKRV